MSVRRAAVTGMIALVLGLPACGPGGRFTAEVIDRSTENVQRFDGPEIDVFIRSHGEDTLEVYLEGSDRERSQIAEAAAAWLGFPGQIAHDHLLEPATATVELPERIIEPGSGDEWTLDLDTGRLMSFLASVGYTEAGLVLCTPVVETRVGATRPPDLGVGQTICGVSGRGWTLLGNAEPLRLGMTFVPEPAYYLGYAAGVLLGTILLGALAWWIGGRLRRGPFPRRSGASVAIGLIGGALAAGGLAALTAGIGAAAGPADNLALSRDLALGGFLQAVLFPALIATAPGIIFATMLIRKGPWGGEPTVPAGIAPRPPGPPGPPPLPWSAG